MSWRAMEVSMSITRRGKYTDSNICMNVQVCDVACLFFLLYANLLVLVTLCEGNHYATGCCCRSCFFKWHHIPAGKLLTEEEQQYAVTVLMTWIEKQL